MKYYLDTLVRIAAAAMLILAVVVNLSAPCDGSPSTSDTPVPQGSMVISTAELANDISGFAGPIHMDIVMTDGKVSEIKVLDNAETPRFLNRAVSQLFPMFVGKTPAEILAGEYDAVSGATLSSEAVIATVRRTMESVEGKAFTHSQTVGFMSIGFIVALIVVLAAGVLPLFVHSKIYRFVQLALNVTILGAWCGTFLSYSHMVNFLSNGFVSWIQVIVLLMMIMAFAYPLFGHRSHYCMWVCPFGALQELVGKIPLRKLKITPGIIHVLETLRQLLWIVLMTFLVTGICAQWTDNEIFTVFMFSHASPYVIAVAIVFVVLSLFVTRPFCRFVCPCGALFEFVQGSPKGK